MEIWLRLIHRSQEFCLYYVACCMLQLDTLQFISTCTTILKHKCYYPNSSDEATQLNLFTISSLSSGAEIHGLSSQGVFVLITISVSYIISLLIHTVYQFQILTQLPVNSIMTLVSYSAEIWLGKLTSISPSRSLFNEGQHLEY